MPLAIHLDVNILIDLLRKCLVLNSVYVYTVLVYFWSHICLTDVSLLAYWIVLDYRSFLHTSQESFCFNVLTHSIL